MILGTLFLPPGFFRSQWDPTYLYASGIKLLETLESELPCLPTMSPLCHSFQASESC